MRARPVFRIFKQVLIRQHSAGAIAFLILFLIPFSVAEAYNGGSDVADLALRQGAYKEAEGLYRDLLSADKNDNDARLGLSVALIRQSKLQEAAEETARVLNAMPSSSRAHAVNGSIRLALGDFRSAAVEFRNSLSHNEKEAMAVAGLALLDLYENRLTDSFNGFKRAASLDSKEPEHFLRLAQVAERLDRFADAGSAYEQFIRLARRADPEQLARLRGRLEVVRFLKSEGKRFELTSPEHFVVPIEWTNNCPLVPVTLGNKKEPFRFVLDTASSLPVISTDLASKLGVPAIARGGQTRAVGGTGRFEMVYGILPSIVIGELRIKNLPVLIRPFHGDHKLGDGFIGLSLINRFKTTIDPIAKTMSFTRRGADHESAHIVTAGSDQRFAIPMRMTASGFMSAEVRIEGVEQVLNFVVDTGSTISVVSKRLDSTGQLANFVQPTKMTVVGAGGVVDDVKLVQPPLMAVGPCEKKGIAMVVLNLQPVNETAGFEQSGILGGNFLRHFRMTFDFERAELVLEPISWIGKDRR